LCVRVDIWFISWMLILAHVTTPGQDSHVSPVHVLQNTTQSSSAMDEYATF